MSHFEIVFGFNLVLDSRTPSEMGVLYEFAYVKCLICAYSQGAFLGWSLPCSAICSLRVKLGINLLRPGHCVSYVSSFTSLRDVVVILGLVGTV